MRSILATALLTTACSAYADDYFRDWRRVDSVLLVSAETLLVADWGQTHHVARHPDEHLENNPVLGSHPSSGDVDRYFAVATLGTAIAAALLPPKPRRWFLGGVVVLEAVVVARNYRLGIRFEY